MKRVLAHASAPRALCCCLNVTAETAVTKSSITAIDLLKPSSRIVFNIMRALTQSSSFHATSGSSTRCSSSGRNCCNAVHPAAATPVRIWGTSADVQPITLTNSRSQKLQHIRCFAAGKEKTVWVCSKCGKEHAQWVGRCFNCQGPVVQRIIRPDPPKSAASGASAARQVLQDDADFTAAGFDTYDSSSFLYDREYDSDDWAAQPGGSGSSSSYSSSWVQGGASGRVPQALSEINISQQQLRLPLLGSTGEEVARVLGGGLVPGSLVLVGGEPGMGKSTLLLQVAGLVAHACSAGSNSKQQQQQQMDASGSEDEDDKPLSARLASAPQAAPHGFNTENYNSTSKLVQDNDSSSSSGWLNEALDAAAAAAAPVVIPAGLQGRSVLYVTAEESKSQVLERAMRLGLVPSPLQQHVILMEENRVEKIIKTMKQLQPAAVVVDSIQTVMLGGLTGRPGGVTQVVECAAALMHTAKELGIATFLVGHVTKVGTVAGPRKVEHLVDVVLYLQGGRQGGLRMLRASKNRHGRVGEVGLFEMRGAGLSAVKDAAALFAPTVAAAAEAAELAAAEGKDLGQLVGTAIGVVQEGIRPLPLEIQALATARLRDTPAAAQRGAPSSDDDENDDDEMASNNDNGAVLGFSEETQDDEGSEANEYSDQGFAEHDSDSDEYEDAVGGLGFGSTLAKSKRKERIDVAGVSAELAPLYRHYVGVQDRGRMAMLLELLTKYTPIKMHLYNLFINVVAGVRIGSGETSTDLAILAAITSSITNKPLPPGTALLAEIGLAGELRAVPNLELRLLELSKLGFSNVVVPAAGGPLTLSTAELGGMQVHRMYSLRAALNHLFGDYALRTAGWRRKKKDNDGSRDDRNIPADGSGKHGMKGNSSEGSRPSTASSNGSFANQPGRRTRTSRQ